MVANLIAAVRSMVQSLVAFHSPPELAAGFTLGMVIGLVPKGNLISLSLCVLLFSLRVNKGLAVAAALLFSCAAGVIDPITHKVGLAILSVKSLQISYACLFNMPLGPWIGFHNTVTSGALLVALYVAYPVYFATRVGIDRAVQIKPPAEPGADGRAPALLEDPLPQRTAA